LIRQTCEVLSIKKWGAYTAITIVAPDIAEQARPGQFVQVGMPEGRDYLLRRPFSIAQASKKGGWAGTLEFSVYPLHGGTTWLTSMRPHDLLDVVGPLGKPFPYPRDLTNCLLIGGGYGAAPLYFLGQELRAQGKRVDMIVGARTQERVFRPVEAKRLSVTVTVTTEDATMGDRGRVTDVLPGVVTRTDTEVVYACGPNEMLRAVAEYCTEQRIPTQVAVEELMACGMGVCWSCVVPVIRKDGKGWDYQRSCVEGPVFSGARVWWDKWLGGRSAPIQTPPHGFQMDEVAVGKGAEWRPE
jgi:dihydroorotate dehydrogenase electron transfer subunit